MQSTWIPRTKEDLQTGPTESHRLHQTWPSLDPLPEELHVTLFPRGWAKDVERDSTYGTSSLPPTCCLAPFSPITRLPPPWLQPRQTLAAPSTCSPLPSYSTLPTSLLVPAAPSSRKHPGACRASSIPATRLSTHIGMGSVL